MSIYRLEEKIIKYHWNNNNPLHFVVDCDEVGRGCLFGDVVVGASVFLVTKKTQALDLDIENHQSKVLVNAKDSKKLSKNEEKRRSLLDSFLKERFRIQKGYNEEKDHLINVDVSNLALPSTKLQIERVHFWNDIEKESSPSTEGNGYHRLGNIKEIRGEEYSFILFDLFAASASVKEIDSLGIFTAVNLAVNRALINARDELSVYFGENKKFVSNKTIVIADGNQKMDMPKDFEPQGVSLVVRGDQYLKSLGLASIVAKIARDDQMMKLEQFYEGYGIGSHKGYGTEQHLESIKNLGLSDLHRRTFTKNLG